ncbi:hypothetical protein HCG51_02825 [Tolypothrix sp. PCC 7910]|uniref:TRADD-N-associated membrane domain-containing protein n=1 Tax=Tolypothrix sp. PCC 7910 TaxID=2099387 RepID=UPI0014277E49|nr:hypothetical protein [Tolypothrix sp. PCC 7910]QIR35790.1 hypothetical protein HCG51_02825 [Tolypothrix sp. PCC 7910]
MNHLSNNKMKAFTKVQVVTSFSTKQLAENRSLSQANVTKLVDGYEYIATQWFEERHRQAQASFNVTIGLWTVTALFGLGVALSVCTNNVPAVLATTSVGLTTGAVSTRFFRLYKEANQSLDTASKELLDED